MNEQIVIYSHIGILLRNLKRQNNDTYEDMGKFQNIMLSEKKLR